ncbi:MAG: nuclear transport factor 2 family protein [Candidatus Acidiferrum sp.]
MKCMRGMALAIVAGGVAMGTFGGGVSARDEIELFNKRYIEMHLKMDTEAILATWAEDGVDLMPGEAPMIGKKAIVAWVEKIVSQMQGYKVVTEEVEFHDIHISGDWASEWATEHQVVQPPGKEKLIESRGKMALVLHREANGEWKVKQEMWNAAPKGIGARGQS